MPSPFQILPSFDFVCHWQEECPTGTGRAGELSGRCRAYLGLGGMEKQLGGGWRGKESIPTGREMGTGQGRHGSEMRMALNGKKMVLFKRRVPWSAGV